MDGLFQPDLPLPPAALPDRLSASDGLFLRGAEPDLSILDPYRGEQAAAPMVRGGDEQAVAPPRSSRREAALFRCQLRRRHHELGRDGRQRRSRARRRAGAVRQRQATRQLQHPRGRGPRMGRHREGCVGGAGEAQAVLYVARTRLEPRRQPRDERDDQGTLGGGAGGGGAGGVASHGRKRCAQRAQRLFWFTRRRGGTERTGKALKPFALSLSRPVLGACPAGSRRGPFFFETSQEKSDASTSSARTGSMFSPRLRASA